LGGVLAGFLLETTHSIHCNKCASGRGADRHERA
jgi:hypothetical protein